VLIHCSAGDYEKVGSLNKTFVTLFSVLLQRWSGEDGKFKTYLSADKCPWFNEEVILNDILNKNEVQTYRRSAMFYGYAFYLERHQGLEIDPARFSEWMRVVHNRLLIAKKLNIPEVPVIRVDVPDRIDQLEWILSGNVQREKTNEQRAREFEGHKEIEAARAKLRQATNSKVGVDKEILLSSKKEGKTHPKHVKNSAQPEGGKSRNIAAEKVGWSGPTAENAAGPFTTHTSHHPLSGGIIRMATLDHLSEFDSKGLSKKKPEETATPTQSGNKRPDAAGSLAEPEAVSKVKPALHVYSRRIAEELNPDQHDVAAAALIQNLSFWQNNKYKQTMIEGRRHSFRSLSELQKDCPYLSKSGIHTALKRLELKLGEQFKIKRDKDKLWFSIGDTTMAKLKIKKKFGKGANENAMNSFYPDDAVKTASIRSAVLLQNLKYQLKQFANPVKDAQGNKYGELNPKKLCGILNFSEDTIKRCLKEMCENNKHLIRHPTEPSFYALPEGFKAPENTASKEKQGAAEVDDQTAEIHTRTAEVHSQAAEVHSDHMPKSSECIVNQCITSVGKTTCINECLNEDGNECFKDCILTESASQLCHSPLKSKGLKVLSDLAEAKLSKMRSGEIRITEPASVHQDALPYDLINPHEIAHAFESEGHGILQQDLDNEIALLKEWFRGESHKVTAEDESKFRRFFTDNSKIDAMKLMELYGQMTNPLIVLDSKNWGQHHERILRKARTPKQFLRYMPQIIHLLNWDGEEDHESVTIEPPFDRLNYAYLGKAPNSKIVSLDDGTAPIEIVED